MRFVRGASASTSGRPTATPIAWASSTTTASNVKGPSTSSSRNRSSIWNEMTTTRGGAAGGGAGASSDDRTTVTSRGVSRGSHRSTSWAHMARQPAGQTINAEAPRCSTTASAASACIVLPAPISSARRTRLRRSANAAP